MPTSTIQLPKILLGPHYTSELDVSYRYLWNPGSSFRARVPHPEVFFKTIALGDQVF